MNIIFIADSATMLLELDKLLINKVNVIWVVYHDSVYKELIKNNISSNRIKFIDLRFPFISKPLLIKRILNKVFYFVFRQKALEYYFTHIVQHLNKVYNPKIYLTDTSKLLSKVNNAIPKATVLHSITYKNFYLNSHNLNYDILFLPGNYHKKQLEKHYPNLDTSKIKLEIIGNLKISHFINKKTLTKKQKGSLLKGYGLNPDWPLVLYAPTYDAFEKGFFFPDKFGDQYEKLEEYSGFLKKNNINLIIKFHHYMVDNFESKHLAKITSKSNTSIFKTIKNHDTLEGDANDLLRASDIVIGDTSGVLTTAIYLNKKIIFIEPGEVFNWDKADIERELRPGYICTKFDHLIDATNAYIVTDDFIEQRAKFNKKIFYRNGENAYLKLRDSLLTFLGR